MSNNANIDEDDVQQQVPPRKGGSNGYHLFYKQCSTSPGLGLNQNTFGDFSKGVASAWKQFSKEDKDAWHDLAKSVTGDDNFFTCAKCSRRFDKESKKRHHEKFCGTTFCCNVCHKNFKSIEGFQRHSRTHHDPTSPMFNLFEIISKLI